MMFDSTTINSLKNPLVVQDITELQQKIFAYLQGKIPENQFRGIRTAKGVYSQRQPGVQMVRIKLPLGKISFSQLLCMANATEKFANGILHITTRQDIQIYDVSLYKTPELWAQLEQEGITLRGSGGNTVRNVTASPAAGIDPKEPFDVTPYAHEVFNYFLRNPVSQEMGRKIKIAFSSSEEDTAFTCIHDLGFIPKIKTTNATVARGFKVVWGGGLGAQPMAAQGVKEFLPEDQLIPFIESVLRVFGRYGERNNRHKARLKFLVQNLGPEQLLQLVEEEQIANNTTLYCIPHVADQLPAQRATSDITAEITQPELYRQWLDTNVFEQKQPGWYGVYIRIPGGDITAVQVKELLQAVQLLVADEIRLTQTQGLLLKYVRKEQLPALFTALNTLGWAVPGFGSTTHITTCRGTNTCNLAISNSMALANVLEKLLRDEYASLIYSRDITIKISGCMNSCGQHGLAHIGFHGSVINVNEKVLPAVQVLLGGGTVGDGIGRIADKIIKVPAKRAPGVLQLVLNDYVVHAATSERFHQYYDRQGKAYFYQLLKPLADISSVIEDDFVDWGSVRPYKTAIGTGECAGAIIDLPDAILQDAGEKFEKAGLAYEKCAFADAIFYAYSTFIGAAKAILLKKNVNAGTQHGTIQQFDRYFLHITKALGYAGFDQLVMQINQRAPSPAFAEQYIQKAAEFMVRVKAAF